MVLRVNFSFATKLPHGLCLMKSSRAIALAKVTIAPGITRSSQLESIKECRQPYCLQSRYNHSTKSVPSLLNNMLIPKQVIFVAYLRGEQ